MLAINLLIAHPQTQLILPIHWLRSQNFAMNKPYLFWLRVYFSQPLYLSDLAQKPAILHIATASQQHYCPGYVVACHAISAETPCEYSLTLASPLHSLNQHPARFIWAKTAVTQILCEILHAADWPQQTYHDLSQGQSMQITRLIPPSHYTLFLLWQLLCQRYGLYYSWDFTKSDAHLLLSNRLVQLSDHMCCLQSAILHTIPEPLSRHFSLGFFSNAPTQAPSHHLLSIHTQWPHLFPGQWLFLTDHLSLTKTRKNRYGVYQVNLQGFTKQLSIQALLWTDTTRPKTKWDSTTWQAGLAPSATIFPQPQSRKNLITPPALCVCNQRLEIPDTQRQNEPGLAQTAPATANTASADHANTIEKPTTTQHETRNANDPPTAKNTPTPLSQKNLGRADNNQSAPASINAVAETTLEIDACNDSGFIEPLATEINADQSTTIFSEEEPDESDESDQGPSDTVDEMAETAQDDSDASETPEVPESTAAVTPEVCDSNSNI